MKHLGRITIFIVLILMLSLFIACDRNYKVTFNIYHDEQKIVYVNAGLPIDNFTPEREGLNFVCWLLDGEPYDINTPVNKNMVLDASWEFIEYTVTFVIDDEAREEIKTNIKTKLEPIDYPTKADYIFLGWCDLEGDDYHFEDYKLGDVTIYAKWVLDSEYKPTLKVSFNSTGAKIKYDDISVVRLSNINDLPTPTWESHEFLGWYLNDELVDEETIIKEINDFTLIAKWKDNNIE